MRSIQVNYFCISFIRVFAFNFFFLLSLLIYISVFLAIRPMKIFSLTNISATYIFINPAL